MKKPKYTVSDLLKKGIDISKEDLIKLAENEIKEWQKFLKDLKHRR